MYSVNYPHTRERKVMVKSHAKSDVYTYFQKHRLKVFMTLTLTYLGHTVQLPSVAGHTSGVPPSRPSEGEWTQE